MVNWCFQRNLDKMRDAGNFVLLGHVGDAYQTTKLRRRIGTLYL